MTKEGRPEVKALAEKFGETGVYCRNLKKQVPGLDIITDYVSIFNLARVAVAELCPAPTASDGERAEPNKSEIRRAVETLGEIPVRYADADGPGDNLLLDAETKRKNFVAARDGLARAFAAYRCELLSLAAKGAAEAVVVRVVKAIEHSLNDRKGLHLDGLDGEIRRGIRAEWYNLLNPIIAGALAAVRKEREPLVAAAREYTRRTAAYIEDEVKPHIAKLKKEYKDVEPSQRILIDKTIKRGEALVEAYGALAALLPKE